MLYFMPNTIEMLCTRSLYCAVWGIITRESLHVVRTGTVLLIMFSNHGGCVNGS